jgi:hypothetical protein
MYPAVSDRDVSSSRIAVPSVIEQRRIVAKLDSLTGRTARARDELGRIPKLIQKYREAILAAAFLGELTREWRTLQHPSHMREFTPKTKVDGRATNLQVLPSQWAWAARRYSLYQWRTHENLKKQRRCPSKCRLRVANV